MGSLIARKKAIMMGRGSILPSEYRQIEYLESSRTQYIYTDVPGTSGIECFATVMWLREGGSDACIFGARKNSSDRIMLIHQYPSQRWTLGYGSSHTGLGLIEYDVKYNVHSKVDVGEQFLTVDGQTVYSASESSSYSNDYNMSLFGCSYGAYNNTALLAKARVYNLSAIYNGALALNVIPCIRKADSKPGMYDTVSGTFYTNNGTGEFIIPS